jgi:GNAT superfamily N-acetyltransferase
MPSPSNAVIRNAVPADIGALTELAATTYHETYDEFLDPGEIDDYIAEHFNATAFSMILRDAASTLMVAADAIHLVGYAQLRVSHPPACVTAPAPIELCRLYVRRDAIGRGHGAALMAAAHAEARRRGCKTIWLIIYPRNMRARKFYRKQGFGEVGTTEFAFGGRMYVDPILCVAVK